MSHSTTTKMIPVAENVMLETIVTTPRTRTRSPALLFLHFWGGSARTFSLTTSLVASASPTIAVSLRGWGLSSKPSDPSAHSLAIYADDICSLINHLAHNSPELFSNGLYIAGHSMGGKLGQVLLTRQADVPVPIKGLVLIAPAPSRAFELPTEEMRQQQKRGYQNCESAREAFKHVLLGRPDVVSDELLEGLVHDACDGGLAAKEFWPSRGMAEDWEGRVMSAAREGAVETRIMVISGELDKVETPAAVEENVVTVLHRAGADVTMRCLKGVGHMIPIEAPEELARIIKSLFEE